MVMNESAHETDGSIKSEHNTKYMLKFINCVVPLCLGIYEEKFHGSMKKRKELLNYENSSIEVKVFGFGWNNSINVLR